MIHTFSSSASFNIDEDAKLDVFQFYASTPNSESLFGPLSFADKIQS